MKRIAILLVLLLALPTAALAAGLGSAREYALALGAEGSWVAESDERIQSLALDGDIFVTICMHGDRLLAVSVTGPAEADFAESLSMAFKDTGLATARTLNKLISTGEEQAFEGKLLMTVAGQTRRGFYLCMAEELDGMYWLPMHGGDHRHLDPNCSGMDVPRLVSGEAAEAMGFTPCSKCAGGAEAMDDAA